MERTTSSAGARPAALVRLVSLAAAATLASGCGARVYEERLERTVRLFEYYEVLNANLHREWMAPDAGISLRVPVQFAEIPPPERPESSTGEDDEEGAPVVEPVDERQPKYLNVEFPGMRGAFEARRMQVLGDNNSVFEAAGYLYVLSNHDLAGRPDEAASFQQDFLKLLCQALEMPPPSPDAWSDERFPGRGEHFVKPVVYKAVNLMPETLVAGVATRIQAFMHQSGDVQVIVLWILPRDVDTPERLSERIPLCLETLKVTDDKLRLPDSQSGGKSGGPNIGL